MAKKAVGNTSWRNGVKHSQWYEKRGRDDIIYICTIPHEKNLTSKHLTREKDNFHEILVKLSKIDKLAMP